jgi:indolepyruvate ferredoxin oxidoreductase beta subunit
MKYDIVLAGVGGQGTLSVSAIIGASAMSEGLFVKQSEVHGMAQRGGAVVAHLRLADCPVASDMIPLGRASLILSMEPMEGLRYLDYLSPEGALITSSDPVKNIDDYPDLDDLPATLRGLPHATVIESERLARQAGSVRATNMVMVGAASHGLPVRVETMERFIRQTFAGKGEKIVDTNLRAFCAGREAAR